MTRTSISSPTRSDERPTTPIVTVPHRNQFRSDAVLISAVFLTFTAGAFLSWESFGSTEGPSFFYPSAGVTAAALMLNRRALWPAIAVAVFAAEMMVDTVYQNPPLLSVAFAVSNLVEPLVGALLVLAWCSGPPDLRNRRDFIAFIAGACVVGPFVGGLIGGTASAVVGGKPWFSTALTWWSGDALGVLVLASPILLWQYQSSILRRRPWDVAALLVVTVLLSVATFWANFAPSILILPVLAWAAFRVGMIGASIGGAVAAFLVNIMSTRGEGPFSHQGLSPTQQIVLTQFFLAVIIVVSMLIAQEAAGRASAVAEREAERRERLRLESLSRLALELSAALTAEDIGQALVNQVLNEAGASAISLGLVSSDGQKLEWVAGAGYPAAMVEQARRGVDLNERTLANDAIRSAAPVAFRDAADFAAAYPERAYWLRLGGAEAIVNWPLAAGGGPSACCRWCGPHPNR